MMEINHSCTNNKRWIEFGRSTIRVMTTAIIVLIGLVAIGPVVFVMAGVLVIAMIVHIVVVPITYIMSRRCLLR